MLTRAEHQARLDNLALALSCALAACSLLIARERSHSRRWRWREVWGRTLTAADELELPVPSVPDAFWANDALVHYLGAQLAFALGELQALELWTRPIEDALRAHGVAAEQSGHGWTPPPTGLSLCGRCHRLLIHCRCPAKGSDASEQVRPTGEETALGRHAARVGVVAEGREVGSCE